MSTAVATLTRTTSPRRAAALAVLFAGVAWLLAAIGTPSESLPRWPADGALYQVDGWTVSPAQVDVSRPGLAMVTHTYSDANGARATFVISTSPMAKAVYRAGPAVPFLGNGYTVESLAGDHETIIARRGNEAWLQLSAYGERRGQYGTGALAWSLSLFDAIVGTPNDYYLARVVVPADTSAAEAGALAQTLFARLATFYAS
jgi:hypothetical protein